MAGWSSIINDFDETIRGPFEWDLKRMAASLVLAGRAAGHKDSSARKAAEACIERYAAQMRAFARMPHLEVDRFRCTASIWPDRCTTRSAKPSAPRRNTRWSSSRCRLRREPGAPRRFKEMKPMLTRVTGARAAAVIGSLAPYREMLEPQRQHLLYFYRPVDVAFKVVGTGSVGLRDYVHLYGGQRPRRSAVSANQGRSCIGLRALSCPTRTLPRTTDSARPRGRRAMQIQTDPFLGWTHIGSRQYLVRQLNDHKGSIEIDRLGGRESEGLCARSAANCWRAGTRAPATRGDRRLHRLRRGLC